MDTTTSPRWGFGCEPVPINAPPASFVAFFPVRDSTADIKCQDISWTAILAAQRPITHQPAWSRVAVQAHPSTLRKGSIMKRVGLPTIRPTPAPQSADAPIDNASEDPDATTTHGRQVRRKLNFSKPSEEEAVLSGSPPSEAEIANNMMRAKVDVTNCILAERATKMFPKLRRSRALDNKIIPRKRRHPDSPFPEYQHLNGSTSMAIYAELNPILERAAEMGVNEVDVHIASIAEASAILQHTRPNPRVHLAASGLPDLSDIFDEPESPLALAKPARSRADSKSPTKRATPVLSSPIKGSSRLSETVVKLVPASSPRAEPSPTKSSAPSTPFKDSPGHARAVRTPSMPRSPLLPQSPLQKHSPQGETPGSTRMMHRLFEESPSSGSHPIPQSPSVRGSPMTYTRPVAPTPSRWNRPEPSTPYQLFTPKAPTPSHSESPLGLMASIPAHVRSSLSPIKPIVMGDPTKIGFGSTTPTFDHGSWLNLPVDASERARVKTLRRRKSEPALIRNCLIAEARRKSVSPLKIMKKIDENEVEDDSRVTSPSAPSTRDAPEVKNSELNNASADVTMDESTAAPTYARYVNKIQATAADTADSPAPSGRFSTGSQSAKHHGIFDIDMRKNLDIFGVQAPTGSTNPAIGQLARMAKDRCNGDANVVISQENGRLVVRFKLPTMYASMFPDNQGADESRFTTSPSAISSSPRLRFQNDHVSVDNHEDSTVIRHDQSRLNSSPNKFGRTLLVSDFGSSPGQPANLSTADSTLPVQEEAGNSSPVAASDLFEDTTALSFPSFTVAHDGTTIPGIGYSSSPKLSVTPKRSDRHSSLSALERTPSVSGADGMAITESPIVAEPEMASTPAKISNIDATRGNIASAASAKGTPAATPNPKTSSTPVNEKSAHSQASSTPSPAAGNLNNTAKKDSIGGRNPTPTNEDDSPEREYMRDFIKRSKPKRPSATESGSPIAPPQRLPLGIKSPNAETAQAGKRKFESDGEENESETVMQSTEPAPKRACWVPKATPRKPATAGGSQDNADDKEAADVEEGDDAQEDDAEASDAPVARRSSRLRGKSTTSANSTIPTPMKVGRGRPSLNAVRTVQQDLNVQTRMNTRKNKGDAEYPAQVLARCSEEAQDEEAQEDLLLEQQEMELRARDGKSVGWKEPLTAYQKEEQAKAGKGGPKTTVKTEASRVAKPAAAVRTKATATTTTQRQRTSRVAAGLGMAGNGTPAKRVTRSQARGQK